MMVDMYLQVECASRISDMTGVRAGAGMPLLVWTGGLMSCKAQLCSSCMPEQIQW